MGNDVYIKNIPLSYLKNQKNDFFNSDVYTKAIKLFDKIKISTNTNNTGVSSVLPLDMIKNLLTSKYFNTLEDLVFNNESDEIDYLVAIMMGKPAISIDTKPRKFVNKAANDLKDSNAFFNAAYVVKKPFLLNSIELKNNIKYKDLGNIENLLPPTKTDNTLFDITKKVKWYESLYADNMYDDSLYISNILKLKTRDYNLGMGSIPDILGVQNVVKSYEFEAKNIIHNINTLKLELKDKYFNFANSKGYSRDYTQPEFKERNKSLIELAFQKSSNTKNRLQIYLYTQISNNTVWEITHNLNLNNNYKVLCFDDNQSLILPNDIESLDNQINITFKTGHTGKVILLFDSFDKYNIEMSLLQYSKFISKGIIEYNKPTFTTTTDEYTFNVEGMDTDYLYFELYDYNEKVIDINKLEYVKISKDNIKVKGINGSMDVAYMLYLPTYEFYTGSNILKINRENILTFLNNYDIFTKEIKIWE